MRRLRNTQTDVIVNVDDATAATLGRDWRPVDAKAAPSGYAAMKVSDLKAEIERRNTDRDEADQLPVDGKKPALVAALEADDADEQ